MSLREAAKVVRDGCTVTLAYAKPPREHQRRNRATQPQYLQAHPRSRHFPRREASLHARDGQAQVHGESEWGSRRYLNVTQLKGQLHRRAGLKGCRKVHKILDGTLPQHDEKEPSS